MQAFRTLSVHFLILFTLALVGLNPRLMGSDTLILKNGDRITGKVKKLDQGQIHVDADYGKNVFIIDWEEVEKIESQSHFLVQTTDGRSFSGTIKSLEDTPSQIVVADPGEVATLGQMELVFLDPVDGDFWGRFSASIDFGINLTKADETKQLTTRAAAGYAAETWSVDAKANILRDSRQQSEATKRTEVSGTYRHSLNGQWFGLGTSNFLQSNELELDLRSTVGGGIGNFLYRSNRWVFAVSGGAVWTHERFTNSSSEAANSGEAFLGIELNAFNVGDTSVLTSLVFFPSLSEGGRLRANFSTDFKWDLPKGLYFSVGFSDNFDNSPQSGGAKNDYIFNTSIGWSL